MQEYAFQPAEDKVWNLNFYESGSNWNQVCNCGMVCGALAIYETCPARAAALIEKSIDSNLNILLEMYAPDGNYPEGYSYWGYGTTFECLMMALLDSTVGTDNGLSASPGFSRTGNYMLHMIGRNGSFNYSDNGSAAYTELPMWYFADKLGDVSLLHYELRMLDIQPHRSSCAEKRLLPDGDAVRQPAESRARCRRRRTRYGQATAKPRSCWSAPAGPGTKRTVSWG